MSALRLSVVIIALLTALASMVLIVLSWFHPAFMLNAPAVSDNPGSALAAMSSRLPHSAFMQFPALLVGGFVLYVLLTLSTYALMPAPWRRPVLAGLTWFRVNWVLHAATVIGILIAGSIIVSSVMGFINGERAARRNEQQYGVYQQGAYVREIDKAESDRRLKQEMEQFNLSIWRAGGVFLL